MKARQVQETERTTSDTATNRAPSADLFISHPTIHLTRACHVFGSGRPSKRAAGRQAGGTQGDSGEALRSRRGGAKLSLKLNLCVVRPNLHFFMKTWTKIGVAAEPVVNCNLSNPLQIFVCVKLLAAKWPRPKLIVSKCTSFLHLGAM